MQNNTLDILTAKEVQRKALVAGINDLLSQCTEKQQAFFRGLNFNHSLEKESMENLEVAYNLCRRTVIANYVE